MANPTTYFGWVMPNSADLVTDLPADFAVFGQGVDTSMQYLLGGTTGQVLSKTSATNMAFTWIANDQGDLTAITAGTGISVTSPTGPIPTVAIDATVATLTGSQTLTNKTLTSPALTTPTISTYTTAGDLVFGAGSGVITRLAAGTSGYVLTAAGAATAPAWAAASAGGKVKQVVFAAYAATVTSASATFATTNVTATITPTLSSSSILVLGQLCIGTNTAITGYNGVALRLVRGSTVIQVMGNNNQSTNNATGVKQGIASCTFLDTPSTTSATTYLFEFARPGSTNTYINSDGATYDNSTILLMEIGV